MNIYRLYHTTDFYQPYQNHDRRIIAYSESIDVLMRRAESEFSAWRMALVQPRDDERAWLHYRGPGEPVIVYIDVPDSLEWIKLDGRRVVAHAEAMTPANGNRQPDGYVIDVIPLLEDQS